MIILKKLIQEYVDNFYGQKSEKIRRRYKKRNWTIQ